MKTSIKKAALRSATCLTLAGALNPATVWAQDTEASAKAEPESTAIIVTGSRIRHDTFTSPEPLTVITRDSMTEQGFNSTTDALQSSSVTQGGSQINNFYGGYVVDGGTGVNTIGLRGLGPTRTLVLLNGHRLAPAGTRGAVGAVDLNTIPTTAVDRVEVLKAGASSIYGSDAVAGVINIITDNKFTGFKLDAQVNVPEIGTGLDRRLSGLFGAKGDNWNFNVSVDWRKRNAVSMGDVDFTKCPIGGYLDGQGTAFGANDYIDPNTGEPKCFTLDNGGVTINTIGVRTREGQDRLTGETGYYNRFVPDASVTGGATPGYAGVDYYTRDSFDPDMLKEPLVTPVETLNVFAQGSYQLNALGNAELYSEFLYSNRKSSSPLYRQLTLDYAVGSPLVPELFRNTAYLNPTAVSNGELVALRSFIGFGLLDSSQNVDFYRAASGLRGDTGLSDWRYDLYGSYSWSKARYSTATFLTSRVAQSLNVVDNGDGTFSCVDTSNGCVAAPVVDVASVGGNLSQAYRDFITQTVTGSTKTAEYIGSLNLDGSLFQLPGGMAKAALGLEYRHSHLDDQPPAESVAGDLYNLTSAAPTVGSDEVWEVYGEVYLPVLANMPGVYNLNFDASGRYTHYRSYGGEWTYKGSVEYAPVRGVTFRGSYGTSYRAPALFEQYLGATSGFLSSSYDPCDNYADSKNLILKANCAAAGLPADFEQKNGVSVYGGGGSSTGLKAETSKNLSLGIILQPVLPQSVGKLSVSLDYFNIEINNGVQRVGGSNIANLCYGSANFNPDAGYCRYVSRDANNALTVIDNYVNVATQKTQGFEFNLRYLRDIGPGEFQFETQVTKFTKQSTALGSNDAEIDYNNTIATPEWTGTFDASYKIGPVKFRYGLDWIKGTGDHTYTVLATDSLTGEVNQDNLELYKYYYKLQTPDYFLHSASIQWDVNDEFEFTIGVRNLTNAKLPRISADTYSLVGNTPLYSGYDYTGRTFFANVTAKY